MRQIPSFTILAGIFSGHHIDRGYQLLPDHLPAHLHGNAVDLGAGWGLRSGALLKRYADIGCSNLFEANARPLACARINLAAHSQNIAFH